MILWRVMNRCGRDACAVGLGWKAAKVWLERRVAGTGLGRVAAVAGLMMGLLGGGAAMAQVDGNTGIAQATTMISGYFDTAINLLYAIGGILGLIGAVRVYSKWSHGDHDTAKVAAAWFSACIFLVVVATVIKSFFGLQ